MKDNFDYPLPSIDIDINSIEIETKDKQSGNLTIKNTGAGTLIGKIFSRCPGLVFNPAEWSGNKQTVEYTFDAGLAGFTEGQSAEAVVYFSSNGGEITLPVFVKLTKMSVISPEGIAITNLREFFEYANNYPANARRMFVDSEFYMFLLAIGYEYMEVYENLHKDANRERALDNFFILSGLKDKTTISVTNRKLEFVQNPYSNEMLYGHITVLKSDKGYVEAPVTVQNNSPWVNFYASKLMQSDFKDTLATAVHFSIDPMLVNGNYAREFVTVGTEPSAENTAEISYRRAAPLVLRLSRASYTYADSGAIEVTNNTGADIKIEVSCPDSYVRFSARSYLVGAYGEITFKIRLSAFLNAQLFFRKLPYMKTTIEIKAIVNGQVHKKKLPLVVGEW